MARLHVCIVVHWPTNLIMALGFFANDLLFYSFGYFFTSVMAEHLLYQAGAVICIFLTRTAICIHFVYMYSPSAPTCHTWYINNALECTVP